MPVDPPPRARAADVHQWVSFTDPDEDRTWVFDVTFLTSSWTCIFGAGCLGVLTGPAPELEQGCCSYGAHLIDEEDRANVERHAARLTADQWQHKGRSDRKGGPVKVKRSGEIVTRLVDDACIFLNRPGFPGGPGCALHRAAVEAGESYVGWKPEVCWQLPLRRVDETDDEGHVTSTVREWKRRDWGDGGADFHWWCTEDHLAFVGAEPVYRASRDELVALVGQGPYDLLVDHLEQAPAGVLLPHPALRAR